MDEDKQGISINNEKFIDLYQESSQEQKHITSVDFYGQIEDNKVESKY